MDTPRIQRMVWTCPICAISKEKIVDEGRDGSPSVNDLIGHIKMTADEQHGPYRELPDMGDVETLETYVEIFKYRGE